MRKKMTKRAQAQQIAKNNPNVDLNILHQSIGLVEYMRALGVKNRGFSILRSSEANIKIKPPHKFMLDNA